MSDSVQRFYSDESFGEKEIKNNSKEVQNILDIFRLLSVEDKISVKRLIREEEIF